MEIQQLLQQFLELLEKERTLLIESAKDYELAKALDNIRDKKIDLLQQLDQYELKDFKEHQELLEKIEEASDNNAKLALNNMIFIEKMFEAIFEEEKKYDKSGSISNQSKNIINKKV